jgi:hypothetical protein
MQVIDHKTAAEALKSYYKDYLSMSDEKITCVTTNDSDLDNLVKGQSLLLSVYKPESIVEWMNSKNRLVNGDRPIDILTGNPGFSQKFLNLVKATVLA